MDDPASFCDGDLAWFVAVDLPNDVQLFKEGVQLVKSSSVENANALQLFHMVTGPIAATLQVGDALLLLGPQEQFVASGRDLQVAACAATPADALVLFACRLDGGGSNLEVGAHVELRVSTGADDTRCVQLRADGTVGLAPEGGLPGTRLIMSSDGAQAGSPHWADPRCIQYASYHPLECTATCAQAPRAWPLLGACPLLPPPLCDCAPPSCALRAVYACLPVRTG